MAERGSRLKRQLDFILGIPLVRAASLVFRPFRKQRRTEPRRVAFLCFGAIGDLLLLSGVIRILRIRLPAAKISIVCSKANAGVVPLLDPEIESAAFGISNIPGMLKHVRSLRADLLIDSSQWARLGALVSLFSGAEYSVGFKTAGQYRHYGYNLAVEHRSNVHETENFLALIKPFFPDAEYAPYLNPAVLSASLESAQGRAMAEAYVREPYIVLHMWPAGLNSHLKEWPREYWGELAAACIEKGYEVFITGASSDREQVDAFLAYFLQSFACPPNRLHGLAGKLALPELARFLKNAAAVVSVNTGIMHLAALAGAPTIGLHGPTSPVRWGPVGGNSSALLPAKGDSAYLNLGFEYPAGAENVLVNLSTAQVKDALKTYNVII